MKTKRIALLLLALAMILSTLVIVPVSAADVVAPDFTGVVGYKGFTGEKKTGTTDWSTVDGATGTYYIGSDADIEAFAALVTAGNIFDKSTIYLTNNVTLTTPIGKASADSSALTASGLFQGTFDGQGYTVTLALEKSGSDYGGLGMFSATKGANENFTVIKNLVIDGSVTQTSTNYAKGGVGAVVGYVYNYTKIENVYNKADVTAPSNTGKNEYAGGFVGQSQSGGSGKSESIYISDSTNEGDVCGKRTGGFYGFVGGHASNLLNKGNITSFDQFAAGIVGSFRTGNINITGCINVGNIEAQGANGSAAGIANGPDNNTVITVNVENCANYGNVKAPIYVAGILSGVNNNYAHTINLTNCDNYGTIITTGGTHAAGILYKRQSKPVATLTNCTQYGSVVDASGNECGTPIANVADEYMINCEVGVVKNTAELSALLTNPALYNEKNGFDITSADDLKALSTLVNVNGLTFKGKTIYLTKDLDMTGVTDYVPAGRWANDGEAAAYNTAETFAFMGDFDGQNFTISNFDVTVTMEAGAKFGNYYTENALAGLLFGRMEGGSISNLNVVNSSVTHIAKVNKNLSYVATGGLIGAGNGKVQTALSNLNLDIDVTGFFNMAGVVGSGFYGTMTNVTRDGLVKNTNGKAAGGFICNSAYAQLTNCINLGDVETSSTATKELPAMFISRSQADTTSMHLIGCVNYGEFVDATGAIFATGGGKHANDSAYITDCVNKSVSLTNVPLIATMDGTSMDSDTARVVNSSNDTSYVADMLKVSFQTKAGSKKGTAVRFIATVDSLSYQKLIYTISAGGKSVQITDTGVCTSIVADGQTISDVAAYGIISSDYFVTATLDNITDVDSFTVQVTVVAADGTEYAGGTYSCALN